MTPYEVYGILQLFYLLYSIITKQPPPDITAPPTTTPPSFVSEMGEEALLLIGSIVNALTWLLEMVLELPIGLVASIVS